jgi:hypothetical protein
MYFDISYFDVPENLTRLLGFKKIYTIGKQLELNKNADNIIADDFSLQKFSISNVVGVRINKIDRQFFQKIREEEKIAIIDISNLINASGEGIIKEYKRLKLLAMNALKAKLNLSIATFAKNEEGLLSSMQMLEVAKFIGLNEKQAKDAISRSLI